MMDYLDLLEIIDELQQNNVEDSEEEKEYNTIIAAYMEENNLTPIC